MKWIILISTGLVSLILHHYEHGINSNQLVNEKIVAFLILAGSVFAASFSLFMREKQIEELKKETGEYVIDTIYENSSKGGMGHFSYFLTCSIIAVLFMSLIYDEMIGKFDDDNALTFMYLITLVILIIFVGALGNILLWQRHVDKSYHNWKLEQVGKGVYGETKQEPSNPHNAYQYKQTENNPEFDFDPSAFGGGSNNSKSTKEVPYGVDKRHPDDAKLWAIVDDPNSSDQERITAFSMILKKQKKRNEGQDSVQDILKQLGLDKS